MSGMISSAVGVTEQAAPPPDFATVIHGAVNPERLTHEEVVWGFFQHLHFKEQRRPGSAAAFLEKDVGIPADAAQSLVGYAQDAYAQNRELSKVRLAKVCEDFTSGNLGPLAGRLVAEDLISSQFQQARIAGLTQVLDAQARDRLDQWIGTRFTPSFTVVKVDVEKMLSRPGAAEAISERIRELCNGGDAGVAEIVSK
jgi:hypothetical protein